MTGTVLGEGAKDALGVLGGDIKTGGGGTGDDVADLATGHENAFTGVVADNTEVKGVEVLDEKAVVEKHSMHYPPSGCKDIGLWGNRQQEGVFFCGAM